MRVLPRDAEIILIRLPDGAPRNGRHTDRAMYAIVPVASDNVGET